MNDRKKQLSNLLGMPLGTAKNKLTKQLLHRCLVLMGASVCSKCGRHIESPTDLAIIHDQPWENDPALYRRIDNIRFACTQCPDRNSEETMISVHLLNKHNDPLNYYEKDGRTYFAIGHSHEYRVKITNHNPYYVEAVVSVDGIDVISGEAADYSRQGGYVLEPYSSTIIEGFRRSESEVARFVTSKADDQNSYAARKGLGGNEGLVGVAVFREAPLYEQIGVNPSWPQIKRYQPVFRPWYGAHRHSYWVGSKPDASAVYSASSSIKITDFRPIGASSNYTPEIGTEYGDTLASHAHKTHFKRASEVPDKLITVEYDTIAGLRRRGVVERKVIDERSAFPARNDVKPGFAAPPPQN